MGATPRRTQARGRFLHWALAIKLQPKQQSLFHARMKLHLLHRDGNRSNHTNAHCVVQAIDFMIQSAKVNRRDS